MGALVSCSCCSESPQIRYLETIKIYLLKVPGVDMRNQGVGKFVLPPEALGDDALLASLTFGCCQHSLAHDCFTLIFNINIFKFISALSSHNLLFYECVTSLCQPPLWAFVKESGTHLDNPG